MKRIISALVLLVLCIATSVISNISIESKTKNLVDELEKAEQSITRKDFEKALEHIKTVEESWEKHEKLFSSMSETKLIDELDLSFNSLEKYIYADETGHALIVIEECKSGLDTISRWQKISIDNIL